MATMAISSIKGVNAIRALTGSVINKSTQATAYSTASKDVYIPPYSEYDGGYNILNRPNRVKTFQEVFGTESSDPVFLKGGLSDVLLYKGIMGFSVLGISIALFSIYRMATGNIKKKEDS